MDYIGWIKSYRKMQNNWIWRYKEPYDRRSAWQYILFQASYEDRKEFRNGAIIEVKRGQFITSVRELSDKWMWNKAKVTRFLDRLEAEHMVRQERTKTGTLLTVVNYGFYQVGVDTNETPTGHQRGHDADSCGTPTDTRYGHQCTHDADTDSSFFLYNKEIRNKEYKEDKKERKEEDISTISKEIVCQTDVRRITEKWNALSEFGVKPVKRIKSGTQVYERLCARIREYGIEEVLSTIDMVKQSDFLLGKVKDFRITLDWFSRPNNFQKIYNGNYDNGQQRASGYQSQTAQMLDSFYDQTSEWVRKMEEEERMKHDV